VIVHLFWHWPGRTEGYEDGLVEFHRRLAAAGVPGLVASAAYRVEGLPWLGAETGYEDWYVVRGFGDLEALNRDAVGPPMRPHHDRPALAAAGGAGGLYRVHSGTLDHDQETVTWLAKPDGTRYPDFYASLPPTRFLLCRQLALGPAPEFCAAGELPGGLVSRRTSLISLPRREEG
jgi:hypothetical protein